LDPVERSILRLATYELLHEPKIPHKVVLNEAVELCRIFGSEEGYRFVNGVLDCLSKQIQQGKESRLPAG
jgi:N utilization substance protein B